MGGKARFMAAPDVLLLPIAAQRNAGKLVSALAQLANQVVAAAVRQSEIADEQVEGVLAGQLHRRGHVAGSFDRVAVRGQHHPHHLRRDAVVFDQQDAQGANGTPAGTAGEGISGWLTARGKAAAGRGTSPPCPGPRCARRSRRRASRPAPC